MYSQLDPKWKNNRIGNSNVTIGGYGCALTCVAESSKNGDNPATPADLASDRSLFTADGSILWNKAFAKIGGIAKYERRYESHLPEVKENQSLLVNVSVRTSYGLHWVLWNNGKILDPLGGVERSLDYYPVVGYNLITWDREVTSDSGLENHIIQEVEKSGAFALVQDGKKRIVSEKRAGLLALTSHVRKSPFTSVDKKTWDSIETGKAF